MIFESGAARTRSSPAGARHPRARLARRSPARPLDAQCHRTAVLGPGPSEALRVDSQQLARGFPNGSESWSEHELRSRTVPTQQRVGGQRQRRQVPRTSSLLSGSFVMPGVRWDGAGGWGWGNSGGSAPPHGGGVERGSVGDTWAGSPFGRSSAALELNGPERFAAQGTTDNINDMPFFTPGGTDGRTDARTHGRTDGRTDGRRERETEGRKGGSVTV